MEAIFILVLASIVTLAIIGIRKQKKEITLMEDLPISDNAEKIIGQKEEAHFELVYFRNETIKMGIYEAWYFKNILKDRTARNKAWKLAKKGKYPFPEIKEMEKDWRATKDDPIKVSLPEKHG